MATSTTPETINGKTTRLNVAVHDAKMAAVAVIVAADSDTLRTLQPLIKAFNDLAIATDEQADFYRVQINFLEQLCRNTQAKADTIAARVFSGAKAN